MQHISESRCIYLGLKNDPETWYAFPDDQNYCHRVTPPEPVARSHQDAVCLSPNRLSCPALDQGENWKGPLPQNISRRRLRKRRRGRYQIAKIVIIALSMICVLSVALVTLGLLRGNLPPAFSVLVSPPISPARSTPTLTTPTAAMTATMTATYYLPSETPTETLTASPTPVVVEAVLAYGANLRTGPGLEFDVIVRLSPGQTVSLLGRDPSGEWVFVRTATNTEGWLSTALLSGPLDILVLPVISVAPTPDLAITPTLAEQAVTSTPAEQ